MTKEMKKVPAIRFRDFTDEWEQRKLSDIAKIVGGGTPSTENIDYWDGDIDWYTPAEIGNKIFASGSVRKITENGLNNSSAKLLPGKKTVLFTSRAGIGNMAILEHDGATNQGFQSLVCNDDIEPYFIFSMKDIIKEKAERVAAGSTFSEISGKKLSMLEFLFPDTIEQKQIGNCFKSVDNLITLHQRKLEQQKNLKKYFLQNMFPAKGEKVPKIRLKGFTGELEQYKLGECLSLITYGFTNPMEDTDDGPWKVTAKDIADGQINYSSTRHTSMQSFLKLTAKSKPKKNDVLLTKDGTLGRTAIVKNENICINQSVALLRCNDRIMPEYLNIMLNSPRYKKEMIDNAGGGTIKHIYITKVDKMLVDIPSLEEQKNIARCFRNFDQLIIAQQHKLVELETLKKYILQNMLI